MLRCLPKASKCLQGDDGWAGIFRLDRIIPVIKTFFDAEKWPDIMPVTIFFCFLMTDVLKIIFSYIMPGFS